MDKIKQRDNLKKGRFDDYRIARNEVSLIIQEAKRSVYKTKIEEGKDDPKTIWKLFKEFGANNKRSDEKRCLKMKSGYDIISDEFDLAERFIDYFMINIAANVKEPIVKSNFDDLQEHIRQTIPDNVIFELTEIDENIDFRYLSTLDVSKATGLDGIGPKMLKLSSGIITKSIIYIVNKCILCGHFPDSWKQAKGNPLFKSGEKDNIYNYCQISIQPTLSKLIENFMHKHLMNYLITFDVLHKFKSGFRSGHSTETALTLTTERWLKAIYDDNILFSRNNYD